MPNNPIAALMGQQGTSPYTPLPGGGGGPTDWIGIYGIIKRLYPNATEEQIMQILQQSMAGARG
jgi:hypothetical protein